MKLLNKSLLSKKLKIHLNVDLIEQTDCTQKETLDQLHTRASPVALG